MSEVFPVHSTAHAPHLLALFALSSLVVLTPACQPDKDEKGPDMHAQDMSGVPDMVNEGDMVSATDLGDDGAGAGDMGEGDADLADQPLDMSPVVPGARVRFDPASEEFFDTPFPSDTLRDASGTIRFSSWEKAYRNNTLELWFDAAEELVDGFSINTGFFISFDAPLDEASLPTLEQSHAVPEPGQPWPSVFLIDVDERSPERGRLFPVTCRVNTFEGRLRVANQIGCVPPWGVVKRPNTTYATVVLDSLLAADGLPVESSEPMRQLLGGADLTSSLGVTIASTPYTEALAYLETLPGFDAESVVSLDLFTTNDPTARLRRVHEFYASLPEPTLSQDRGLSMIKDYGEYFVVEGFYDVPIIQDGELPYSQPPAGKIAFDASGNITRVDTQQIRFYLTLPKTPMGERGYPVLMYLHGSGGVSQQLMERGPYAPDGTRPPAGSGPARVVAPYGIAGFAADFQLHGMRFDPPDTSGLKLYNLFENPRATIDNFLVAANEVVLHARLLEGLVIDPASIRNLPDGALDLGGSTDGMIRFDDSAFVTMGQSMGSTIGLPAATIDTIVDGTILSGSGGSLVEIASTSTQPVNVAALLRTFLAYKAGEPLDQFDPVLHVLQHAWDIVDPLSYSRLLFLEPTPGIPAKHVLQHSGLNDGYFSPEGRAGLSAAMGVELVSPVLEPEALEIMKLVGLDRVIEPPASGNTVSGVTGVVRQYPPSVLDGHHVAYQREDTKAEYACFIKTLANQGTPVLKAAAQATPELCD